MVPLVIVSIALMSRGDRVTGVNYRYASAARLGIAWAAQLAAPSSWGVATETRRYDCSPRALDGFSWRLPRARSALEGLGRTARRCQALPALGLGSPPVRYLSRAVPDRAPAPFRAGAGLADCKTLAGPAASIL